MRIALESPDQAEVIALIGELDAYQDTLYRDEARYALDLALMKRQNVVFEVARNLDSVAIGCGALVVAGEYGELKRMFVRREFRGRGAAQGLIGQLEASAIQRGCKEVLLETGPYQYEALAFYEKQGYSRRGPFGAYPDHPLSVFMGKDLGSDCAGA